MANGQIPSSSLGRIPGSNAGLVKPAALAYTAMHYRSVDQTGVSLAIYDGQVGRAYRSYARQLLAKQVYGSNAATPGYSNHGWGLAVDLMSTTQRSAVDRVGAQFGWAKKWSDASWEYWHLKWRSGVWSGRKPDPLKGLGARERKICERLLYHRREYIREARGGKGPRYRKQYRYALRWRKRLRAHMNALARAGKQHGWKYHNRDSRYQTLARVLSGKIT